MLLKREKIDGCLLQEFTQMHLCEIKLFLAPTPWHQKSYCMAKGMLGRTVQGEYKIMGAVSSKKPCDRGGQNSIVQALPTNVYLQDMAAWTKEKAPFCMHSRSSIAYWGGKAWKIGTASSLVHLIQLVLKLTNTYQYVGIKPFFTTIQERWLIKMSLSN